MNQQTIFLLRLDEYIKDVKAMPRFRGQTQAVAALKRISKLAVFKEAR